MCVCEREYFYLIESKTTRQIFNANFKDYRDLKVYRVIWIRPDRGHWTNTFFFFLLIACQDTIRTLITSFVPILKYFRFTGERMTNAYEVTIVKRILSYYLSFLSNPSAKNIKVLKLKSFDDLWIIL